MTAYGAERFEKALRLLGRLELNRRMARSLGYAALHLTLISASILHWHRWTIQLLPVVALLCGYARATSCSFGSEAASATARCIQRAAHLSSAFFR